LLDGATSIGAVTWPYYMKTRGKRSPEQFLLDTIGMRPTLAERLKEAKLVSEVKATGNFSYLCDHTHGPNEIEATAGHPIEYPDESSQRVEVSK
jgi:hypothetical protein